MSEERTRRRRRRMDEEASVSQMSASAPQQQRRIVVSHADDTPEWMVSAASTSGAASRRTKGSETPAAPARERSAERVSPTPPVKHRAGEMDTQRRTETPQQRVSSSTPTRKSAPKKPVKKPKKSKARAKRIRRNVIAALCALVALALVAVAAMGIGRVMDIKETLDRGDGVFYPNIFVNGIPLEGKTLDEAARDVTAQVNNLMATWKITLKTQDGRTWDITSKDLNMQYDIADQLDQLWAIGHIGSSKTRYEQVKALENNTIMRYTTLRYDMTMVNQILAQIKSEVDRAPVNAMRVYDENLWPPYSYTADTPGQELDITGLGEKICQMVDELKSGTVELVPVVKEAAVTREALMGQIVQLAMYETGIGKTGDYVENRHENIRVGTEKFNRITVKPGESVSFNKVTGLRSTANGFKVALELAYGEYVEGVGGGICQVSSTLYNAIMNVGPGLTVTKRTAHSHPSNYVPMGLDATVQDNRLDFTFRNDTKSDIFIESKYYKKKNYYYTQFVIYGRPDPDGLTYELVSEVVEELPIPEVRYVQDKEQKYVVYNDEEYVASKGDEGYIVDVYRVAKDARGLEVSREKLYTDTYKPSEPVTYIGVIPRETPVPDWYTQGS